MSFLRARRRRRRPREVGEPRPPRAGGGRSGASAAALPSLVDAEPRLPGGLGQREAVELLGVLVRLAEALLSSGSPVADVVRSVLRAARGAGLGAVQVDITYTAVTVCAVREDGVPLTALRVVRGRDQDYARLSHLYALARAAGDGMDRQQVAVRLAQVLAAPPERPLVVRRGAVLALAAAVAVLSGAGPGLAAAAAIASLLVVGVRSVCSRVSLPPFFTQAAGAASATALALALLALPQDLPGIGPLTPGIVVGPGIVVLLAGLSLVESGEDAIAGYYVTAGARAFEAVVMTTGLVVGIGGVLALAARTGTSVALAASIDRPSVLIGLVAALVAAAAQALTQDAGRRATLLSGAVGGSGWLTYRLLTAVPIGGVLAVGLAALVIGVFSQAIGPRLSSPPVVVSICGIVPMLPGLAIYRAIASLSAGDSAGGSAQLVAAGGTALALAAGTTLGLWLAASPSTRRWTGRGARRRD